MDVLVRTRRFIAQHDLIPRGARVLAAVSGGSDSIALAHVLRELNRKARNVGPHYWIQ